MNAIFAVNTLNGFGTGQDMPWPRLSQDLRRFKELTTGKTVVMGSGTWNSNMPKPLPNRRNCVLSKTLQDDRCEVFNNISELLENIKQSEEVFVIGGAHILWQMRHYIKTVYLTTVKDATTCNIVMNTSQYLQGFQKINGEYFNDHNFEVYKKIS